ncbi:peptide ABC transporter permease [Spirochaetia bacterium]|nr:peptide ABC transporter permease [Spirochaetia bacterium]
MVKYITKRVLTGILTLYILVTITFFLVRLMPGNPFAGENITQSTMDALKKAYNLDAPLLVQYQTYLLNLLHGDMGISFKKPGVTVNNLIAGALPATMSVGIIAFVFSFVFGTIVGIWQASVKNNAIKGILLSVVTFGISMPNFIVALLLLMLFGIVLGLLPVVGLMRPASYILPVLSLSFYPIATTAKLVNSTYTEAMNQDFVTLARAKGLKPPIIAFRHILRNAMIPVITYMGPTIAFLLTGSFVVENIFTIPGLGMEFVKSISNRDYTVILGLTVFMGAVVIAANLMVDIICCIVDPRIKLSD